MTALTRRIGALALVTVAVDQLTKVAAKVLLPLCVSTGPECRRVGVLGILRFARYPNGGSALGFGQGKGVWTLLAAAGTVLVLAYSGGRPRPLLALAVGLQVGGSVSNLLDRLVAGRVTDFIVVPGLVINLADVALVLGTVIATIALTNRTETRPRSGVQKEVTQR